MKGRGDSSDGRFATPTRSVVAQPREIWFERTGAGNTWRPVHADGWRALVILIATLAVMLLVAVIAGAGGLRLNWFIVAQIVSVGVAVWFLWSIRGRVR